MADGGVIVVGCVGRYLVTGLLSRMSFFPSIYYAKLVNILGTDTHEDSEQDFSIASSLVVQDALCKLLVL